MYLPRNLLAKLYIHLQKTQHALSPPVLILCALEPDALAACRILSHLFKDDHIVHQIIPIAGYGDLEAAGKRAVCPMMQSRGGTGGVVICLGVGGLIDLGALLGIEGVNGEVAFSGVDIWVVDARRPWHLTNVFGGMPDVSVDADFETPTEHTRIPGVTGGRIGRSYKPGLGGIVVLDDGDIEEDLSIESEAYLALVDMPPIDDDDGNESDDSVSSEDVSMQNDLVSGKKRKSWSDQAEDNDSESDADRPRQRRRSKSSSPVSGEGMTRPPQRGLAMLQDTQGKAEYSRLTSPNPLAVGTPSARSLRKKLLRLRKKHETVLEEYYSLGTSYSEPISSMMYSLASELGRENNDLLWLTIVGVTSMELYGRTSAGLAITTIKPFSLRNATSGWLGLRGARIRQLLRDEVRRLNPPELSVSGCNGNQLANSENSGIIPTTARSPNDTSIRLSPEPRFLLIRHWSLYDSMLHSPYLSTRLRVWSDAGRKRLHKLLAKMGVSLVQCKQSYTHMDMDLKRVLRQRLLKYSEQLGLEDMVPPANRDGSDRGSNREGWGFVRSWGWRATLSAQDVCVIVGAILKVGRKGVRSADSGAGGWDRGREVKELADEDGALEGKEWVGRFYDAYHALENVESLKTALPIAQHLHRAILRTGTSLIEKRQIRHLRAFRMAVVKDGPDVALFTHPAALTKLALWVGEAIAEQERESKGRLGHGGRGTPLVLAGLNEGRGVYIVVGTGGGGGGRAYVDKKALEEKDAIKAAKSEAREKSRKNKELIREQRRAARRQAAGIESDEEFEEADTESEASESESSESEKDEDEEDQYRGYGRNKFGNAFQQVVDETRARVRIDSFEHCVVEVKKEDLSGFLESLSMKAVVG